MKLTGGREVVADKEKGGYLENAGTVILHSAGLNVYNDSYGNIKTEFTKQDTYAVEDFLVREDGDGYRVTVSMDELPEWAIDAESVGAYQGMPVKLK